MTFFLFFFFLVRDVSISASYCPDDIEPKKHCVSSLFVSSFLISVRVSSHSFPACLWFIHLSWEDTFIEENEGKEKNKEVVEERTSW